MLVDINFQQSLIDKCNERLKEAYSPEEYKEYSIKGMDSICHKIRTGVYYTGLNFDHDIKLFSNDKVIGKWDSFSSEVDYKDNYGVCDNYEQILSTYGGLYDPERKFVVSLTEIRKDEQPEQCGWRWEKWGEYIGSQNSQADYLFDEPEIECVFAYRIYEIQ